jgi:hypothetical protein
MERQDSPFAKFLRSIYGESRQPLAANYPAGSAKQQ